MKKIPIAEDQAESVHKDVKIVFDKSKYNSLSWAFSSVRLETNLETYDDLCAQPGGLEAFSKCWHSWKSVLQTSAKKEWIPKRINTREFVSAVYLLNSCGLYDWDDAAVPVPLPEDPKKHRGCKFFYSWRPSFYSD